MSKMSELHRELSEQAVEMGYSSLEYATDVAGCEIDYEKGKLLSPEEAAHNALLKEREKILGELISVYNDIDVPKDYKQYIKHAIDFIKQEVR